MIRIVRAVLGDALLTFAALCDRVDTALANACNSPEDET